MASIFVRVCHVHKITRRFFQDQLQMGKVLPFFMPGSNPGSEFDPIERPLEFAPPAKLIRYEPLVFYHDQSRDRKLCAFRKAVLEDRRGFELYFNLFINISLYGYDNELTGKKLREEIVEYLKISETEEGKYNRKGAEAYGMGPTFEAGLAFYKLILNLDEGSLDKLAEQVRRNEKILRPLIARLWEDAPDNNLELSEYLAKIAKEIEEAGGIFRWVRFENEQIRFILPATEKGANDFLAHKGTKEMLTKIRQFATPVDFIAVDEGVAIVFGRPGEPIRLSYVGTLKHNPELEAHFLGLAPKPEEVKVDGKPATAAALIEQFLKRASDP